MKLNIKNDINDIKFIYSSGAMGFYGEGHWYHRFYNFPILPFITKTLTSKSKIGFPFAVFPFGKSVWNKVSLSNMGIKSWMKHTEPSKDIKRLFIKNCFISIYPTNSKDLNEMVSYIDTVFWSKFLCFPNIEINLSCPNVGSLKYKHNIILPNRHQMCSKKYWLKLNYLQNPTCFDLDKVDGIRLNSIPTFFGGLSGRYAQDNNWNYIDKYKKYINISGCSWNNKQDLEILIDSLGCKEICIGSVIITNPGLVESLSDII